MDNAICLSFDIEEFDVPEEHGIPVDFETKIAVSRLGTERILEVLNRYPEVKATFYVTAQFAEACPDLIAQMVAKGEIASHGFYHSQFEESDLEKSRIALEKLSGQSVTGFRMPRMAKVAEQSLYDAGFRYDSSLNPTYIPGRYNSFFEPASPFKKPSGLLEIPASVSPLFRFPLFWLAFKNTPLFFFAMLARWTLASRGFLNVYWHPWEFNEAINAPQFKIPGFMRRSAGVPLMDKLDAFIRALRGRGTFMTTQEFSARFN